MAEQIFPVSSLISFDDRMRLMKQKPGVIWMTGLSGSGKTTIAQLVEKELLERGYKAFLLDGDNLRDGLNSDLNFSDEDRKENIRRCGELCKLFYEAGMIVITSFISPFREERKSVRELFPEENFIEVFVKASLDACEARDVKGLYKKARSGVITDFTGISSPYEEPVNPDVELDTEKFTKEELVVKLLQGINGLL